MYLSWNFEIVVEGTEEFEVSNQFDEDTTYYVQKYMNARMCHIDICLYNYKLSTTINVMISLSISNCI